MNEKLLKFYLKILNLTDDESGQDLIEYALMASLVGVAAISGMSKVAAGVNTLFSHISSSLA